METITISNPYNERVKMMAEMVRIRNEFMKRGFVNRRSFVGVVQDVTGEYLDADGERTLVAFWLMQAQKDPALIQKMDSVLDQIMVE
jgi:hypothetical protein